MQNISSRNLLRKARDLEEERAEDPRFLDEQYGKDGLV